jgi:oxygen-dependent protoporphyrinogen oxidase
MALAYSADVIVVGAGISGLATAFRLHKQGVSVVVAEAASRTGGAIGTRRTHGFLIEAGPNSMLETTPLMRELVREIGVESEVVPANAAAKKRYILRGGRLVALPMSPGQLLVSRLFSFGTKLRLAREPFVPPAHPTIEETVADFVRRRLGQEFLDYAINPFVAGVFAGDPEHLSVRAAFPRLAELEQRYGSLIRGQIRGARERKASAEKSKQAAPMLSFAGGMQTLTDAIAAKLPDLRLGTRVTAVVPLEGGGYKVRCESQNDGAYDIRAHAVVIAVPAYAAAPLVAPLSDVAARELQAIPYPPVASVVLGFRRSSLKHALDGFGFLVPAVEHRRILGTIFSSTLFPGRAPEDQVALTTFAGGARQPDIAAGDEDGIALTVRAELKPLLKVRSSPVLRAVTRWERAIPQYNLGHLERIERITALEREHPGLLFCANWRGGISVGDCIKSAAAVADRLLAYLASAPTLRNAEASEMRGGVRLA